ncbi:ANTAR domain-containing response regulator [Paenibacillus arenilitoris]|uniref:ANTAR domain-containing protein n=1 Tax=Paenibacillus arenilitoris TaxID=2772299 RepID=A0A927H674_9BACL|nr:ANTAR domain-containing protein [Paenibacillus arenilitoris]MBD2869207.1 ANTAR domain-containing protein [Paenibacillus arenilitoris]
MRSLLVVDHRAAAAAVPQSNQLSKKETPKYILENYGYHIIRASDEMSAELQMSGADAVVIHLPLDEVKGVGTRLLKRKAAPMLWWCSASAASMSAAFCEDDVPVDGILTPSMSEQELHWALHFAAKQCFERQQWLNEKKQLEGRLEERKWIDMAKGILCKIKNISEAEAYEVLRKQAMNERKRMVDVATSIVKVYQLLQEQK